jgi:hypothetical protein
MSAVAKNDWFRALWAGLLSLVLPGLGQVYAGVWRLGLILYALAIVIDGSWIALTRLVAPTAAALVGEPASQASAEYRETLPNGRVYTILETPQGSGQNTKEFTVPPGSFFALGDNRGNSLDSRFENFGYVPIANVIGIVRLIWWSSEPGRLLSRVQ